MNIIRDYRVIFANGQEVDVSSYDVMDAVTQAIIEYNYEQTGDFPIPEIKKVIPVEHAIIKTFEDLIGKSVSVNIKGKSTKDFKKKNN